MQLWSKLKKIALTTALCITSGCSASYIFVHPDTIPKEIILPEVDKEKNPLDIEKRMTNEYAGYETPPGGALGSKIKLDTYQFYNRFYARLNQRASERIDVDLQESTLRDYHLLYDPVQYIVFVQRSQFSGNDDYRRQHEREFTADFYKEIQKLVSKSLRDTLKDINLYELLRPFVEFDIKRDAIPFTDKKIVDIPKENKDEKSRIIDPLDEFDERILNPHKVPREELSEDWLAKRVTDVSLGLNINYDIFKTGGDFGLEPYFKWMDLFRWTYSTRNRTIEHKISFPIYSTGFGFAAETNETLTRFDKIDASFSYAIQRKGKISISAFKEFYDIDGQKESNDQGFSLDFYLKF